MRTVSCLYKNKAQFNAFINEKKLDKTKEYYICIHTSIHHRSDAAALAAEIKKEFPASLVIGTSASAIMYNGDIYNNECMIMFTEFEKSTCKVYSFSWSEKTPEELAVSAAKKIITPDTKAMFVFFSDHYSKTHFFLEEFNKYCNNIKLIGGIVSAIENLDEVGYVFSPEGVLDKSVIIVSLESKSLNVYSNVLEGHEPVGDVYTITKADKKYIDEIDGCNSVEWMKNMLGVSKFIENNYNSEVVETDILLKFPLVLYGYNAASRFLQYEEPTNRMLQYHSELNEGQKFRVGYLSPLTTANECKNMCDEIVKTPVETIFTYSCVFRMQYLNHCAEWELTPFKAVNVSGAFMYGEIGNKNGHNEYLNGADSIIALAENEVHIPIDYTPFEDVIRLKDDYQELLNYVLKKQNECIYSKNSLLLDEIVKQEEIVNHNLFVNAETQLENMTKFILDTKTADYNKMCMVSIEKGALLLGHLGEDRFLEIFREDINSIKKYLELYTHLHFYYNNPYSFFFVSGSEYSKDDFIKICERLYLDCSTTTSAESITIINQFVVVMDQDNLLSKARLGLETMNSMHNRFYIYEDKNEDEVSIRKTLEMVNIINDAIKNDYISPFFQPIHNNKTGRIEKYEALMRIHDKNGKIYYPDSFLPVAKDFKLYLTLSMKMIGKVFALLKNRTETVSINLSAYDINSKFVRDYIMNCLKTGDPSLNKRIIFEILESEDFEEYDLLKQFIADVRSYGVKIAIDDYGSGYSNMLELVELKPDFIKIDGEIITDIDKYDIKKYV